MGIQGSGKSTQGNLLSKKFDLAYLSSGHIFREIAKEKTSWGRYVKETINAGILIPDDKTVEIVKEYLSKPQYEKGYILDGFPRTVKQAKDFTNGISHVFYIKVSDKEALWRLAYRNEIGREDETLNAIKKRIELYHKYTEPVLTYYRRRQILHEINGEESIAAVNRNIMKYIHVKAHGKTTPHRN
jgi:adenylate kinase